MGKRSANERWYDEEIAPALLEIGKKVEARGLSMLAAVEYESGNRGDTVCVAKEAGLHMQLLRILASVHSLDAFMINAIRYCRKNGIDTSASIAITRFGGPA